MNYLLLLLSLSAQADSFHYKDCVQVLGGFYEGVTGVVVEERAIGSVDAYRIDLKDGNSITLDSLNLKLMNKKECR